MKKFGLALLMAVLLCCNDRKAQLSTAEDSESIAHKESPIFHKVPSSQTNINFNNAITEDVSTIENLFDFDYFYNGAGVGMEDLNNDGLLDIFFCGNQVDNKLFLNKGNLTFEDISKSAGINTNKGWSNGVTFVDINNDGWMDIYVSQGGPNSREVRKNLLFINQKDLTFKESADAYGLADPGISTQSAFFDYDRDGDLDCIVMNENELYGVDPINLYRVLDDNPDLLYYNSAHFYQNNGGTFKDVTLQVGIQKPIFGLGLAVSDINNDGWLDIYMASDYYIPDVMYINNGNGTFTDKIKEFTNHISYYGMGVDIADINNDELQDIFVLDMAASDHIRAKTLMASMNTSRFDYLVNKAQFHHQYMYNSLQLNTGMNSFNDIAQLSETANTDWSWSVLLSDFNNNGYKDAFITNGYRKYALDNDLQIKVFKTRNAYRNNIPLNVKKQLYESMPSEKLPNILYENNKNLQFKNVANQWGLGDFSFSNGSASGDLDNDGDIDLVVNNMDENAFVYQNLTVDQKLGNFLRVKTKGKVSESFAQVKIYYEHTAQLVENKRVRGYMSSQEPVAHFGIGQAAIVDSVTVLWPGGKVEKKYKVPANTVLTFSEEDALTPAKENVERKTIFKKVTNSSFSPAYTHLENDFNDFDEEVLLPYKQSTMGPFISKGDINGDGKDDLYIGGASGQAGQLYVQNHSGFTELPSKIFTDDRDHEDMESAFFDFDGDGDLDLFVVSGGNEFEEFSSYYADRLYLNDGQGNFTRYESNVLRSFPKSGKSIAILDFDKDGDNDILVGNRIIPKNYPLHSPSVLYENDKGVLKDVTEVVVPELTNFGIVNSIITTDFNNDGWEDFIAVGEWTTIGFFENKKGKFINLGLKDPVLREKGWWFSVRETDVNKDGLKDYIIGNAGLNLKFKASKEKPFKIFADDFDGNGTNDIVLSKAYNSTYVPVRGRECSSQQMPFIQEKFPTYNEFANASLSDIYGEKLNSSYQNEVTEFNSILLLNKGKGEFEKKILPIEAQLFPVLDCVFYDINEDGFEDAIVAGNIFETEVETPRLDAFSGLVLLSNKKDGYIPIPPAKSGLSLSGNVKSLAWLPINNKRYLLAAANNKAIQTLELNK